MGTGSDKRKRRILQPKDRKTRQTRSIGERGAHPQLAQSTTGGASASGARLSYIVKSFGLTKTIANIGLTGGVCVCVCMFAQQSLVQLIRTYLIMTRPTHAPTRLRSHYHGLKLSSEPNVNI